MDYEKILNLSYKGGNIHKQIGAELKVLCKPGMRLFEIQNNIENRIKELTEFDPLNPTKAGIAFPVGLSLNEIAAHDTPDKNDFRFLTRNDVLKVDYGINLEGVIIDAAQTISYNEKYDNLLEASRSARDLAIKLSGPDAMLGDIGESVQEHIESFEIDLDNKYYQIKSIKNLTGHSIDIYQIHGKKSVPNFKIDYPVRMKSNEIYAIECFTSTHNNILKELSNCSHYMIDYTKDYRNLPMGTKDRKFLDTIEQNFSTLAFCKKWLDDLKILKYDRFLKSLSKQGVIKKYPPISDIKGSYTAQFEHTIGITDKGTIIFS